MVYLPRVADNELASRLSAAGAVLVEGPKFCGKTETARRASASEVLLDVDRAAREALSVAPDLVLGQQPPLLLDEWQIVPELWDLVRREVDARRSPGQFILTGSATPTDDARRHSGAGRFSVMRMRPMCLAESRRSDATVSLTALLDGATQAAKDPGLTVAELAEVMARGGWPALLELPLPAVARSLRDYLTQITHVDVLTIAGRRRDPVKIEALVRSLARNTATEVSATTLAADAAGSGPPLDRSTVTDYMTALERLMVLDQQPAWTPSMRSRARCACRRNGIWSTRRSPWPRSEVRPRSCWVTLPRWGRCSSRLPCAICACSRNRSPGPSTTTATTRDLRLMRSSSATMGDGALSR